MVLQGEVDTQHTNGHWLSWLRETHTALRMEVVVLALALAFASALRGVSAFALHIHRERSAC